MDRWVKVMTPGTKLGPYEILSSIGAGGMGEVYLARDSKLGREVALKVLAPRFASDPDRMARFEREARVLASLNHPNIATIYGREDSAIVMELVEGLTLADRIKALGPMAVEEGLSIALQIIEALDYAHDRGVIHRDLKTANIKITPDGKIKVLDFGLAKALADEPTSTPSSENSPTLTLDHTQAGVILGTAAYMSPEQVNGKPADRRADIWAFGVVMYEMLTGKRPFTGETTAEILSSVMKDQPLLESLPATLRPLIARCLEKNPRQRLQAIGEARIVVESLETPLAEGPPVPTQGMDLRHWAGWAVAIIAALAFVFFHPRQPPPAEHTLRYTIAPPENSTVHSFAISPDGKLLAIAAAVNGKQQLWLRPLDALQTQPMPNTEDAQFPFWSPDSRYIGFFAQGKLKKIAASGGPSELLCDSGFGVGGTWNRDGVILFSTGPDPSGSLKRVQAAGGAPADIMKAKEASFPRFLPDGRRFLYTRNSASPELRGIYLSSLDGGENRRMLADVSSVLFAPAAPESRGGFLLFRRESTLMAQPFDAISAQLSGSVFPIAEGVTSSPVPVSPLPATISESGMLLYGGNVGFGSSQMVWYDRAGKILGPVGAPGGVFTPSISPDAKSIAYARLVGGGIAADIWLRELGRGIETRLTADPSGNYAPVWSPGGDNIVWVSSQRGSLNLYKKPTNGSGKDEALLTAIPAVFPITDNIAPSQWSRDGRFIVYSEIASNGKRDLWVLPVWSGDRKPFVFLKTEFDDLHGQLSPDSRWMAYASDETGRREVYVRPFPSGEGVWRISINGGDQPRWRGDGKELFYVSADGKVMAASVRAAQGSKPTLEPATPVALFDSHILNTPGTRGVFQYDVSSDGKQFVVVTNNVAATTAPLMVVVNWSAGLKK